jgi:aromatic ring-opening dioxygenase catalytic subunit (LigB family)
VHEGVSERFVKSMRAIVEKLRVGDPREDSTEVGPIIHPRQVERVLGYIDRAVASGAQLLWGGRRHPAGAQFIEPTMLTGLTQSDEIVQNEVFGPVLTLQTFLNDEEAVALANGTDYGLGASATVSRNMQRRSPIRSARGSSGLTVSVSGTLKRPFRGDQTQRNWPRGRSLELRLLLRRQRCDFAQTALPSQLQPSLKGIAFVTGKIVGAALVSHHPGLMQCEEFRVLQGAGRDSDLIAGYSRLRQKIAEVSPQVVIIFDSHWFTTGYHLVDGGAHFKGTYTSDEMPWYLHGVPYDYRGQPELASSIETVSRERVAATRVTSHPDLARHYATINLVKQLGLERSDIPVVTVSSCQNCDWPHFLASGESIGEAISRSGLRVLLLASGALSHKFNSIDWKPIPEDLSREQCPSPRIREER